MLKWLSTRPGKPPLPEVVTDDPLATLQLPTRKKKKRNEIYAVSRVNPIFEEDEVAADDSLSHNPVPTKCSQTRVLNEESPAQSGSSGYASSYTDKASESSEEEMMVEARERRFIGTATTPTGTPTRNNTQQTVISSWPRTPSSVLTSNPNASRVLLQHNPTYVRSIHVGDCNGGGGVHSATMPRTFDQGVTVLSKDTRYVQSIAVTPSSSVTVPRRPPRRREGTQPDFRPGLYVSSHAATPGKPRDVVTAASDQTDSIVTDSVLVLTSFSYDPTTDGEDAQTEGEVAQLHPPSHPEQALQNFSNTLSRSRPVTKMTRALVTRDLSSDASSTLTSSTSSTLSTSAPSRRVLRGSIGAMRELWEKSGRRLNGRRLLVESDEEVDSSAAAASLSAVSVVPPGAIGGSLSRLRVIREASGSSSALNANNGTNNNIMSSAAGNANQPGSNCSSSGSSSSNGITTAMDREVPEMLAMAKHQHFYNPQNRFSPNYSRLSESTEDGASTSGASSNSITPPSSSSSAGSVSVTVTSNTASLLRRNGGTGGDNGGVTTTVNGMETIDLDAVDFEPVHQVSRLQEETNHIYTQLNHNLGRHPDDMEVDIEDGEDERASQGSSPSRRVTFSADTKDNERPEGKSQLQLMGGELRLNPRFLHEELAGAPLSLQNALLYGSLGKGGHRQIWESYYGAEKGLVTVLPSHPNYSAGLESRHILAPDFTLDTLRHQLLLRKIQTRKRRQCMWRVLATIFLIVVFVLVVVVVSMLYTRGQRYFGAV